MAERGITDVIFGIIALVFFIGGFGFLISDFDSQYTNNEGYGQNINLTYQNLSSENNQNQQELYNSLNGSSFSISATTQIDTRGYSQVGVMTKNSPATITNFFTLAGQYLMLNKIVSGTLLLFIIVLVTVLIVKAFVQRKI